MLALHVISKVADLVEDTLATAKLTRKGELAFNAERCSVLLSLVPSQMFLLNKSPTAAVVLAHKGPDCCTGS